MAQHTNHILMIRPVHFTYNEQTASTNAFQQSGEQAADAQHRALAEFNQMVQLLNDNGMNVMVVDDTTETDTPDAIFPNNWFSTHEDGMIAVYPMAAENRRLERRADIMQLLSDEFIVDDIADFSAYEKDNKYLEGTGSMVLDRDLRICYACISPRTNKEVLQQFCNRFGYELLAFDGYGKNGAPVYHTNVMMCVGEKYMIICMDCIPNKDQQHLIRQSSSKELIEISKEQMEHFAGNALEVINDKNEVLLVMSTTAYEALTPEQVTSIEKYARILHTPLNTIERNGGGSARCMMAEIFLPGKK